MRHAFALRPLAPCPDGNRLFFLQLYRWFPSIVEVMTTIRPETLVRWHRAGFRRYWRWKSRNLGGRPPIDAGLRALIRRMSIENTLWGAPRIHGELLKLGRQHWLPPFRQPLRRWTASAVVSMKFLTRAP